MKYLLIIASLFIAGFAYGQTVSVVAETGEFVGVPTAARIDVIEAGTSIGLASNRVFVGQSTGKALGVAVSGDLSVATNGAFTIADEAVTLAKMADMATLSVIGRSTEDAGVPEVLIAETDSHVLRRSGTTLGFGLLGSANLAANAAIAATQLHTDVQTSLGKADSAIQPTTEDYTNAVALAGSAVQTEADPVASPVINALIDYLSDGLLADGGLAISAESALKFKTTQTAIWTVGGVAKAKVAEDEIVFSAADTINVGAETNTFYGAWLVEVDSTGTVATKPAGGLTDQVYEASETAIDALPAATAGSVALGYILIELEATAGESFTANTDALTTIATFVDGDEKTLPAKIE